MLFYVLLLLLLLFLLFLLFMLFLLVMVVLVIGGEKFRNSEALGLVGNVHGEKRTEKFKNP